MEPPKLYDQRGAPYVKGFPYYKDHGGRLIRVPGMFDSKQSILNYLVVCASEGLSIKDDDMEAQIEEFWKRGEKMTNAIITHLDQRASELAKAGSIRHLIYRKTKDMIGKLNVPVFNRTQLEKLPNMSKVILDELDPIINSF